MDRVKGLAEQALLSLGYYVDAESGPEAQHEQRMQVLTKLIQGVVTECGEIAEDFALVTLNDTSSEAREICDGVRDRLRAAFDVVTV